MAQKIFDYCGRFSVRMDSSDSLLERISGNIHKEILYPKKDGDSIVNIHEPDNYDVIIKDKRYPYSTFKVNPKSGDFEYYRYNTFVRSIKVVDDRKYEVKTNIDGDEASGLICFRNYCNRHPSMENLQLVHASLVELDGEGILISGDSRSGKTTLMVYLMEHLKAGIISEDNVYLERDMQGLYFPKVPRVRFSTVRDSCLSPLLDNISETDATQYWDLESIEELVSQGNLDVDGGLAISMRKVADMCGVNTNESTKIRKIIFPFYSPRGLNFRNVSTKDGVAMLRGFGREKKKDIDPRDIAAYNVTLEDFDMQEIKFYSFGFGGFKDLVFEGFGL